MAASASTGVTTTTSEPSTTTLRPPLAHRPRQRRPRLRSPGSRTHRSTGSLSTTPTLLDRRLLAVKIDNHPNARPHSGINHADMVFEIRVEGMTRFLTMWMQSATPSSWARCVRAGPPMPPCSPPSTPRPSPSPAPRAGSRTMITSMGINLITERTPATFRVPDRRAPHNLFANTNLLRDRCRCQGTRTSRPTGPDVGVRTDARGRRGRGQGRPVDFLGNPVDWTWDEATGTWLRSPTGRSRIGVTEDETQGRIGFPVLIGLVVEQYSNNGLPSSHDRRHRSGVGIRRRQGGRGNLGTGDRDRVVHAGPMPMASTIVVPTRPGMDLARSRHRRSHLRVGRP